MLLRKIIPYFELLFQSCSGEQFPFIIAYGSVKFLLRSIFTVVSYVFYFNTDIIITMLTPEQKILSNMVFLILKDERVAVYNVHITRKTTVVQHFVIGNCSINI